METSVNSSSPSPSTKIVNNIQSTHKTKLSSLKDSFKCELCGGYIINATTINECLHSFCRSCIVKHFNRNHDCPKCGLKFSETSKWETLRMDSMLQSLIYKLIPGLFRSEMKLRREFHSKSNDSQCDYFDEQKVYYQLDEKISVVLMYSKYCNDKSKKMIGPSKGSTSTSTTSSDEHRYLLCPAGFPIASLKKFICLKYELSSCFKVDIMFDDKILDDDLQLLDIVYLYSTQQPIPLHFKLNNFAVHKNNQTTTTSKSQINAIKKSVNNHQLSSPNSTSLTSSSSSSSSSSSTKTSASSLNFHMKTTTTTSTASTNTPNNGNAKNDVKNDNTTLKSVAVQSSSVITCATSPMNPVSSSTPTDTSTRNSPSLSSQNIDQKNQLETVTQTSKLVNEREKQAMHSVSSCIKPTDTKRVIKPKVINTKLAPMVNQINLKRSTTSVLPCSTQVTTVTLNKQSKPSTVKTNKQSNMFVKSVELTNRETNKRFMNGYDNIGLTPISCSQSTPKVTSTATVSSTPSVSITATTMITTTSHGAKNNFISKHLSQMNNESEKRKESDCKSDKSEGPRKQMKVSQVNDKINSVTSSNQNDSSKSPSAPTSPKASSTQINTIDKAASNNVVNKITRDVNENCKTSHSVGTSISPNNSQTSVNAPKSVPSPVITNTISAGNSNVSSSKSQNNKNHQSTNGEVKSNGIKVDDKVVKSSNTNAIKAPSVSSSQSSTVTSKPLSSSSSSSSPHLVIAPSPSPSTSSSSPSPKLSSTTSVTSSKPSTSTSSSSSSSSSCTSTLTPTSTKVVSSSFYPTTTSTSTSTSTSISRLINNQQQKVKQSGQGDKRHRESPSSPSPGNAPDNRPSKMVKISKNQTLNSQHKSLQIQHQQQHQKQQQQQLQQFKLHQQMIGNHDQLANDSVFNVKALIADEKEAALNKNSPQTGFTLKSMPVDLRNPRNVNKSGGLHAIPSGPFQHFHHFANPSSVLVPIATGSSGHASGPYHESTFPHLKYLEYTKFMSEALMQHLQQANNAAFGVNLNPNGNGNGNVNGNVNVNGKSIANIEGERVKGFYKETLCNSPNRENGTKNDKN